MRLEQLLKVSPIPSSFSKIQNLNKIHSAEKGKGGIFNPADLLYYVRNKLMKPYLPMAMIDPIWFREETKKKTKRLVWSSFAPCHLK